MINSIQHTLEQFKDFRKRGYKCVLAAPEEIKEVVEQVEVNKREQNIGGLKPTIVSPAQLQEGPNQGSWKTQYI